MVSITNLHTNNIDHFVMTRFVNHPELIFNQNPAVDSFFDLQASRGWKLSNRNECFDCQKFKYVAICFDQNLSNRDANHDLKEINNNAKVCQIREWLNLPVIDPDRSTPIICGSFINGGFTRKLKMLRIDYYSLMLLTNSNDFITSRQQ